MNDREEASESETSDDGNESESSDDGNDSDEIVDNDNPLEHVHVDMDNFDKDIADTMGQDAREFNANEGIEVNVEVMDNEEFENAEEQDALDRVRQKKLKRLKKQHKP